MICGGPGCSNKLPPYSGIGRRPEFCSEGCRKRRHRANRHVHKAAELVDLVRTVPTAQAVTALSSMSDADLDRSLVIARRDPKSALNRNTGIAQRSRNDRPVIVTPSEDASR